MAKSRDSISQLYGSPPSSRAATSRQRSTTVRRREDASGVDVSLTISAMRGEAGKIVGASTIARDI
jgi:hypothetical protein